MALLPATDAITFAIEAGLKLYGQARTAYVEQTRMREITLPLPGPPLEPDVFVVNAFFEPGMAGHRHLAGNQRLTDLHARAAQDPPKFAKDRPAFREYQEAFWVLNAKQGDAKNDARIPGVTPDEVAALFSIAQWRRGEEPNPSALQRIAGTLVEIGVDWYGSGPGKIRGKSARARVLRTALRALDDQSFAEQGMDGVAEKLFVAALETAEAHPEWFTGGVRTREIVGALAKGLAADVKERLAALGPQARLFGDDQLADTAALVFRSILRHGGETVLAAPDRFLSVAGAGQQALVGRVGSALLDALVPPGGQGLDLFAGLTAEKLDGVVKEALRVVAEHPELVGAGAGKPEIARIVQEVAAGLAASDAKLGGGLAIEAIRLTLERGAANLALLRPPQGAGEVLATTAVRSLLEQLAAPPAAGDVWTPKFGKANVFAMIDAVLDEAAQHPEWVTRLVGGRPALAAAASAVLAELRARDLSALDRDAVAAIVLAGMKAAAGRLDFLDELTVDGKAKLALAHILDAVFSVAASNDPAAARARWTLARSSVLAAVVQVVLDRMAQRGVDAASLAMLRKVLAEAAARLGSRGSFSVEELGSELAKRLAA